MGYLAVSAHNKNDTYHRIKDLDSGFNEFEGFILSCFSLQKANDGRGENWGMGAM
jgi:hypothetical protein